MKYELIKYADPAALAKATAAAWLEQLSAAKTGQYNVALSGGRITKVFFSEVVALAGKAGSRREALARAHFFWADERCVPPTDPESNYAMARELLFEPLKIEAARIHRLRGEGPEPLALREAVDDIRAATGAAKGQPVLDMIFLGMGEDGHVASLFPGEPEAVMKDEAVFRAVTAVKPPPRRITLGYGAITAAREVWVVASGAGKEAALKESLALTGKTPLGRVLQARVATKILTDIGAC